MQATQNIRFIIAAPQGKLYRARQMPRGGGFTMAKKSVMSDQLKYAIANQMGVGDTVKREGWGSVSSRDCGKIVRTAIEMAERSMRP
jgi:small acid-soluble spore protein F (minor alpha/beta-type SASP)